MILTCALSNNLNTDHTLFPTSAPSPPPPPPPPSSSSPSLSTCSSSSEEKPCCSQSTKDRLRSILIRDKLAREKALFKQSTFIRLIEDNFITISLQDELLSLESSLRQFEENKFNELTLFTSLFDERITPLKCDLKANVILDVEKHAENWIKALKKISSFINIGVDDQIICIKRHFTDLSIIKGLIAIDPETKTLQRNGFNIYMGKCPLMTNPKFVTLLSSENNLFRCDPKINLLIVLIYLFDANIPNLRSTFIVRKEYIVTVHLLQKYLQATGLTTDQANSEINRFITDLTTFLTSFNAKQKALEENKIKIRTTSQLLTEIMEID